ncbi:unnamed protein product [Psylliodes chrysocephalus]|uniref:Phorbol-ester/DAG-type domain-containing protein n=1 Tax=Psylliodes chrysocephalus TaxID=3402493 RepID=A0A9P0DC15_9CUCU|nr:unnamed protein product [Psylliodes chrysocephala]
MGDNKCKRCKKSVTTGLSCVICGVVSHPSCLKSVKNSIIIDDNTCNCCSDNASEQTPTVILKPSFSNSELVIKVTFLEEIIRNKDMVIFNQEIAIKSLQSQVDLMKKGSFMETAIQTNKAKSLPTDFNSNRHTVLKEAQGNSSKTPISRTVVSSAIANAQASNSCHDIIHLNKDSTSHRDYYNFKSNKPTRKLLTGNMNVESNSNLKASIFQEMKHLHSAKWDPNTLEDELSKYLQSILPATRVKKLNARYPLDYASFKISVPAADIETILQPELWPSGPRELITAM